jgi:hypothetical protein
MDKLIKEIEKLFEKYIDKEKIQEFLKDEENFNFGYKYWFWFKSTNVLNITNRDFKNSRSYSQKLGLRIVITFSLIESLYSEKFGENIVISFFSKSNINEQFLFNWIIEMKDPTRDEEIELLLKDENAGKDHHQLEELERKLKANLLLDYLFNQRSAPMKQEFEKRIKYLYALRSQIVHQGRAPFFMAISGPSHEGIFKSAPISSFPKKGIEDKILYFRDHEYGIKFGDILEDLVFISFLRNKNVEISKKFFKEFERNFLRILQTIQKNLCNDFYSQIRQQLQQYLKEKLPKARAN